MSKQDYPYPDDEFDVVGASRTPIGVHREPVPRWKRWLPYLLVLILVPLLTVVAVKFFANSNGGQTPEALPTESVSPEPEETDGSEGGATMGPQGDGDAAETDGADAGDDAADDDTAEGAAEAGDDTTGQDEGEGAASNGLDRSVSVLVLNGTGIDGLSGQVSQLLESDGWSNVEPENYTGTNPTTTKLYYTSEAFAAEAQEIASRLGIDDFMEDSASASNGIVIVLRLGFTLPNS